MEDRRPARSRASIAVVSRSVCDASCRGEGSVAGRCARDARSRAKQREIEEARDGGWRRVGMEQEARYAGCWRRGKEEARERAAATQRDRERRERDGEGAGGSRSEEEMVCGHWDTERVWGDR
jgi:hypothetical protein